MVVITGTNKYNLVQTRYIVVQTKVHSGTNEGHSYQNGEYLQIFIGYYEPIIEGYPYALHGSAISHLSRMVNGGLYPESDGGGTLL